MVRVFKRMTNNFSFHFIKEDELTPKHHQRISDLLVLAFPKYADLFSKVSFYYARPHYRLWLEDADAIIVAHLDFEERLIDVNGTDVLIAGVGEVATHPDYQKQGLGRLLMSHLQQTLFDKFDVEYGLLQCRETVVGYYQAVGWHRIEQSVYEVDIDTNEIVITHGPTLILPIHKSISDWQMGGEIDLRGLPW